HDVDSPGGRRPRRRSARPSAHAPRDGRDEHVRAPRRGDAGAARRGVARRRRSRDGPGEGRRRARAANRVSVRETRVGRREFGVRLAAAAPLAASTLTAERPEPRRLRPVREAAPIQARPFPLNRVRLLSGSCYTLQDRNRSYLHTLDPDRLLHTFRLTAGLPSNARQLGGWERPDIELRGHFMGHSLSACALMYGSTGDALLKGKASAVVAELGKCQKANADGWLSAFPSDFMQRLVERLPVWAPFYTLHKILAGLVDMYQHCGDERALTIALGMAAWTKRWADARSDAEMARILEVEYGGMNEVLYNLHALTGEPAHADLA